MEPLHVGRSVCGGPGKNTWDNGFEHRLVNLGKEQPVHGPICCAAQLLAFMDADQCSVDATRVTARVSCRRA